MEDSFYLLTGELLTELTYPIGSVVMFKFQLYYKCDDFIVVEALESIEKMFVELMGAKVQEVVGRCITSRCKVSEKEFRLNWPISKFTFQCMEVPKI